MITTENNCDTFLCTEERAESILKNDSYTVKKKRVRVDTPTTSRRILVYVGFE